MRASVTLGPRHEKELHRLMEKWNLDINATVGRIISETVRTQAKRRVSAFVLMRPAFGKVPEPT